MSVTNKDALATTGASFYIHNDEYDSVVWHSDEIEQPTLKWCQDKRIELQAIEDATQYQRDRQYPNLGDQLDMLFHDMTAGKGTKDGEWYKTVAKVKSDNPKE